MLFPSSVSIPYGTIKRPKKKRAQPCAIVSIPYGTIKSNQPRRKRGLSIEFQFLMVRLKDKQSEAFMTLTRVSIPYGTIKRITIDERII